MARLSARQIALNALRTWRKEKRFADSIVSASLAKAELTASDRAFALELFYGVLRNLTLLDFWIGCLRASRIETTVRQILRLGLYQVLILKTPEYAAVHETVGLAPQKQRPIVNAILRAAARQRNELLPGPMPNPCPFGHLIRNSWSNDGDSTSALTRPKCFVRGTMPLHGSMAELIG